MPIEYERVRFARGTEEEIDNSPDMMNCELGFCTDTNRFVIRSEAGVKHKFNSTNDITDFMDSKGQVNGLAPLDSNGKVDPYISESLLGMVDVSWDDISDKPSSFTPAVHGSNLHSGVIARYSELPDLPATFTPTTHDHTKHSGTLGLYSNLSGIPPTFPPSDHGHGAIDSFIGTKGQANGLAPLDSDSKVNSYVTDASITSFGSSTARALTARFGEVFNVKDYGAVGDCTTDDTTAIWNAIAAAGLVSGIVYFPSGIYRTSGNYCLDGMHGLRIIGAGTRNTQILICHESNDLFYVTGLLDGFWLSDITFTSVPIQRQDSDAIGYNYGIYIGGSRYLVTSTPNYSVVRKGGYVFNGRDSCWIGCNVTIQDIEMYGQFNGISVSGAYLNLRLMNIIGMAWSGPLKTAELWESGKAYGINTVVVSPNENKYWYCCMRGGVATTAPSGFGPYNNGVVPDGDNLLWWAFGSNEDGMVYWPGSKGYPSEWKASCSYKTGYIVFPTIENGCWYYCTTAGTSGSSQPSFPTSEGATVSDGSVVWTAYLDWDGPSVGGAFINLGRTLGANIGWEVLIDRCYCDGNAVVDQAMPTLAYGVYAQDTGCVRITNSLFLATTHTCIVITGSVHDIHGVHYVSHCHFDSTAGSHLLVNQSRFFTLSDSQFYDSGSIDCGRPTAVNKSGDSTPSVQIFNSDRNTLSNCIIQNSMGNAIELINSSGTLTGFYIDCYGNGDVNRSGILISGNGSFGQGWVVSGCHVDNDDPGRYPLPTNISLSINTDSNKLVVNGNYFGEWEWHNTLPAVGTITIWAIGITYYVGYTVLYSGSYYVCNSAHVAANENRPGVGAVWTGPVVVSLHNFRDNVV